MTALKMPLDAAVLHAQELSTRWALMGLVIVEGKRCPVYACGACYRQRYTIVHGGRLPDDCAQCGKPQAQPIHDPLESIAPWFGRKGAEE